MVGTLSSRSFFRVDCGGRWGNFAHSLDFLTPGCSHSLVVLPLQTRVAPHVYRLSARATCFSLSPSTRPHGSHKVSHADMQPRTARTPPAVAFAGVLCWSGLLCVACFRVSVVCVRCYCVMRARLALLCLERETEPRAHTVRKRESPPCCV